MRRNLHVTFTFVYTVLRGAKRMNEIKTKIHNKNKRTKSSVVNNLEC